MLYPAKSTLLVGNLQETHTSKTVEILTNNNIKVIERRVTKRTGMNYHML